MESVVLTNETAAFVLVTMDTKWGHLQVCVFLVYWYSAIGYVLPSTKHLPTPS